MKRLCLLLFSSVAIFGEANILKRPIGGEFADWPVFSIKTTASLAPNQDVYGDMEKERAYKYLVSSWEILGREAGTLEILAKSFFLNEREGGTSSSTFVDIKAHGAYATFSSTSCNTISGSSRVTLGAASYFKNGEYATCYNAGPAPIVSRPSAPKVTPSVHDGGMTATKSSNSTTSYGYEIVAEDRYNGRSATSEVGSTSVGSARLGQIGYPLIGCTRSNQTVTCTTGTNHDLMPAMQIWVQGLADQTFNGNWVTVSPTRGTKVTFLSGWDTRNGATSSTGVTRTVNGFNVWGWRMNRISWAHDTNALRYHIYGPNCPTSCNWIGQSVLDYWDDYGPAMRSNQSKPAYIPTVAPTATANQHFTFRILSGGGTTTLTASADAGTSVANNGIVSDAGPAIKAAATAAQSSLSTTSDVLIPNTNTNYQVNSYTDLSSLGGSSLVLDGVTLILNQPLNASNIRGIGEGVSSLSFSWKFNPIITGAGYPLLVGNPRLRDLIIGPNVGNGGLGIYMNTPVNVDWDDVALSGGANNYDCLGQAVLIQNFSTGFYWNINKYLLTEGSCQLGGAQYTGDSPVPTFVSTGAINGSGAGSGLYMKQGWFVNRGSVNLDYPSTSCTGENTITAERYWTQNNTEPAFSISGPCSGLSATIRIVDGFTADYATPQFVNYGTIRGTVIVDNISPPASGVSIFGGNPIAGLAMRNVPGNVSGTNSQSSDQVTGTILDGNYATQGAEQALTLLNEHLALGAGYSLFTNTARPAAPTCSVAKAGPPYTPAGTWQFRYGAAFPPNAGVGPLSLYSSSCVADGTSQQITITIPAAISGAEGYTIWRGYDSMLTCSSPTTTSLTYVWRSADCGPSAPQYAGGGPAGISQGNINAASLVLGATTPPSGTTNTTKLYMDSKAKWPAFKSNENRVYAIVGVNGPITDGHNLCADGTTGAYVDCLIPRAIAMGTAALGTTIIASKTCATVVTVPATGVITADVISYSFNSAPSGAFITGLVIQSYVTLGNVNFLVCNPTEKSLLPPPTTLNWRVAR